MSEKKWFIYVQDHHEGPFTVEEIWAGLDEGRFQNTGFVWADGMKDWVAMDTQPEFTRPVATSSAAPPVPPIPTAENAPSNWQVESSYSSSDAVTASEPVLESRKAPEPVLESRPSMPIEEEKTGQTTIIEIAELESATQPAILRPAVLGNATATRPSTQGPGEKTAIITPRMKPFIIAVVVLFGIVGLQRAGLLRGVEDKLGSVLSTLPELADVVPEEYQDLKKAVKAPIAGGPQVAIALSKSDPLAPIFYVTTNLPDGARFEIYVEGVPHRLLNTLNYSGKLDVATSKRLAKSQPLRYPDGKPIPRGEYLIYVMEAPVGQPDLVYKELLQLSPIARNLPNQLPQDRRLVFMKKIFFGAKDATYEQRLKEFHDGLVSKAKAEATELSQAAATLDSQALASMSLYDRLKFQPIGPRQKQAWNDANRTWRPIEAQLVQKYAGVSTEQLKEGYFHANLIGELLAIEKILSDMHSAQEKLFTTTANMRSLEGEVLELRNLFNLRKGLWKAAIDRAITAPTNPETGLPVNVKIEPANASPPAGGGTPNGKN